MKKTKQIIIIAMIAALYFVLTLPGATVSYGPIQIRFSEIFTVFPILFPEAVIGVTLGCLIANSFSPFLIYDMTIGVLVTLVAAILTRVLRKNKPLAAFPPVILNALILPIIFKLAGENEYIYLFNMLFIFISQTLVVYGLGLPILKIIEKRLQINE